MSIFIYLVRKVNFNTSADLFYHSTVISFSLQLKKHVEVCSTSFINMDRSASFDTEVMVNVYSYAYGGPQPHSCEIER